MMVMKARKVLAMITMVGIIKDVVSGKSEEECGANETVRWYDDDDNVDVATLAGDVEGGNDDDNNDDDDKEEYDDNDDNDDCSDDDDDDDDNNSGDNVNDNDDDDDGDGNDEEDENKNNDGDANDEDDGVKLTWTINMTTRK
jgi:hypothetical protein